MARLKSFSCMAEIIEEEVVESSENFTLVIVHGRDNFSWRKSWMPSARSHGRSATGFAYDNREEAISNGRLLLSKKEAELQEEMKKWFDEND